jgi:hypothetical protein
MTPRQYKATIAKLGFSQVRMAVLFGYSPRAGQAWAAKGPPPAIEILVRLMLTGRISEDDVRAALKQ